MDLKKYMDSLGSGKVCIFVYQHLVLTCKKKLVHDFHCMMMMILVHGSWCGEELHVSDQQCYSLLPSEKDTPPRSQTSKPADRQDWNY